MQHPGLWFSEKEIHIKRFRHRIFWGFACACLISAAPMAVSAQNAKAAGNAQSGDKAKFSRIRQHVCGRKRPGGAAQPENRGARPRHAGALRQKQIADESTQLLALAMDLKAEVDKTNRDMLSIAVIRKANEIEKLAHNVKDKLKQTSGGS